MKQAKRPVCDDRSKIDPLPFGVLFRGIGARPLRGVLHRIDSPLAPLHREEAPAYPGAIDIGQRQQPATALGRVDAIPQVVITIVRCAREGEADHAPMHALLPQLLGRQAVRRVNHDAVGSLSHRLVMRDVNEGLVALRQGAQHLPLELHLHLALSQVPRSHHARLHRGTADRVERCRARVHEGHPRTARQGDREPLARDDRGHRLPRFRQEAIARQHHAFHLPGGLPAVGPHLGATAKSGVLAVNVIAHELVRFERLVGELLAHVVQQPVGLHGVAGAWPGTHRVAPAYHRVGEVVIAPPARVGLGARVALAQAAGEEDHRAVRRHIVPGNALGIGAGPVPGFRRVVVRLDAIDVADERVVPRFGDRGGIVSEGIADVVKALAPVLRAFHLRVEAAFLVVIVDDRVRSENIDKRGRGREALLDQLHVARQPRLECVGEPAIALRPE